MPRASHSPPDSPPARRLRLRTSRPGPDERAESDDARLVRRAQGGDHLAFSQLYLRHSERVHLYLVRALGCPAEAEDAAQEVFLRAFDALAGYEQGERPFRAWLFAIARNHAVDRRRRGARVEAVDPTELDRWRESHEQRSPLRFGWLSIERLQSLVGRLPLAQRQVLVLRYLLQLTPSEAAEVLHRSPNAVRQLEHRALRFLHRRLLSPAGREPSPRS